MQPVTDMEPQEAMIKTVKDIRIEIKPRSASSGKNEGTAHG
jgi:hypothetical protein